MEPQPSPSACPSPCPSHHGLGTARGPGWVSSGGLNPPPLHPPGRWGFPRISLNPPEPPRSGAGPVPSGLAASRGAVPFLGLSRSQIIWIYRFVFPLRSLPSDPGGCFSRGADLVLALLRQGRRSSAQTGAAVGQPRGGLGLLGAPLCSAGFVFAFISRPVGREGVSRGDGSVPKPHLLGGAP